MADIEIKGVSRKSMGPALALDSSSQPVSGADSADSAIFQQSARLNASEAGLSGQIEASGPAASPSPGAEAVSLKLNSLPAVAEQPRERISYEEAKKLAQSLSNSLNEYRKTKVQFNTEPEAGATNLRFQVIDAESGKVVREFPPEIAKSLAHRLELLSGKPLLRED